MSKFNTITSDDWKRQIARARATSNLVAEQIRKMSNKIQEENEYFLASFNAVQKRMNKTAHDKGWYESKIVDNLDYHEGDGIPEVMAELQGLEDARRIALMHSELSEGLEGLRHGNPPSEHIPEFSAIEEELADTIIRIMDFSEERGWRIAEALLAKAAFNANRPHRHGGKAF